MMKRLIATIKKITATTSIKFTDVYDKSHKNSVHLMLDKGQTFMFPNSVERIDTVGKTKDYLMDKPWREFYASFRTMEPFQEKDAKIKMKRLLAILDGTPFKAQGTFEPVINADGALSDSVYAILIVRK